jgi:hypothetical protein
MPLMVKLRSLRRLHLYFLPYVANRETMLRQLRLNLPSCKVSFPKSEVMGLGYEYEREERVAEERRKQQNTPKV